MYSKKISFRDWTLSFDYTFDTQEGLVLESWEANEEIPCGVLSQFLERAIYKWLDEEYSKNGDNYLKDYLDYLAEKSYRRSQEF